MPMTTARVTEAKRALTSEQWAHVDTLLESHPDTPVGRRLRRGMRWLHATGLQLAELTDVTCGDLARAVSGAAGDAVVEAWIVSVKGRGGRVRQVGVPTALDDELGDELARHGCEPQVDADGNRGIHVMARFDPTSGRAMSWSPSGLHQAIKVFFAQAADSLDGPEAAHLRKASARWLRHPKRSRVAPSAGALRPVPILAGQSNACLGTDDRDRRVA